MVLLEIDTSVDRTLWVVNENPSRHKQSGSLAPRQLPGGRARYCENGRRKLFKSFTRRPTAFLLHNYVSDDHSQDETAKSREKDRHG